MKNSKAIYGFRSGEEFIGLVWETDLGLVVSYEGKLDLKDDLVIRSVETGEDVKHVDLKNVLMSILPVKRDK